VIYGGAIPGMLRVLDPHSVFFDRDQFEQLRQMQSSVSKGFGSVVSVLPGRVIILQTQSGSPSQRAGLLPATRFWASTTFPRPSRLRSAPRAARRIPTAPGRLVIRRQGTAGLLSFTMVPAEMQADSVDRVYRIDDRTGYLRVTSSRPERLLSSRKRSKSWAGPSCKRSCSTCAKIPAAR